MSPRVKETSDLRNSLLQNLKMAENTIKIMMKSLRGIQITEDIVENVIHIKEEIIKLDDNLSCGQKRTDNENRRKRKRHGNKKGDKSKDLSHPVNCNICSETFQIISDLEKHIKREHIDSERFKCKYCEKKFVTKWRVEKHLNIHFKRTIKSCKYFLNETFCPFEELGCKFRHNEYIIEKEENCSINDKNPFSVMNEDKREETGKSKIETKSEISSMLSDIVNDAQMNDDLQNETEQVFVTSTPKKYFPCKECAKGFECTDCIVVHMLGMHGVAKATFKSFKMESDYP